MRSLITTCLTLLLGVSLTAQAPQGATNQPDVKAKPAEKPPVGAKTAEPTKTGPDMPKPAPEMERLIKQLEGRWTTEEKHEPSEMLPQGGTGQGQEQIRPGPGRLSMIVEYSSQGPMGEFSGIGLITWGPAARVYRLYWTDNTNPALTMMTGRWEGKDIVFSGSETMMGKKVFTRHAITELTPNAFTYTIDTGQTAAQLKRAMTFKYTRLDVQEMRRRQFRGPR
ncbi:MAG: DUF1579 family protein [Terriglobales bacterium]